MRSACNTTLSRPAQALAVALPVLQTGEPLHLSVYGEDKWEVRKRGWSRRRTWGLAMDANTGQSCVALTILQDEGDGKVLPRLLDQISADVAIDTIGNDGAYESETCHARIAAGPTVPSNPRREDATPWPESTLSASLARSQQVADVNGIGGWLPSSLAG